MKLFEQKRIFVFGSNEAGRHGKGAALFARKNKGAIYGQGFGLQGDSFGIPTKSGDLKVLPLDKIKEYVKWFILYATRHPEQQFQVTRIGCGLAGYSPSQIKPLFKNAPDNCFFDWENTYGEPKIQ